MRHNLPLPLLRRGRHCLGLSDAIVTLALTPKLQALRGQYGIAQAREGPELVAPSTDTPVPLVLRRDTQPELAAESESYERPMLLAMLRDMYPIAGFAAHPLQGIGHCLRA